ncbi:MAG: NAD-dependent protein deacylase [Clostridiales Family XIII bacterium]|jgi:NAD-dependent deacetylase|nr:NAD-dependent protein deacylase [Clostridiales Family XIII bacterium]
MDKLIDRLAAWITESSNIVFFGGAGVSTESGIPDFRSESGLYNAKSKYGRSPEEIISHSFFTGSPEVFYEYYKDNLLYPDAKPNNAHLALAALEREGKLLSVITQNIDGLHQLAGSETVRELHGSVLRNNCMRCGASYDLAYILNPEHCTDKSGKKSSVPRCRVCGGMVKPDVVLYEESLDTGVMDAAARDISSADMLIVGGTSLVVYPAAGFLNYFRGERLVLINKSQTGYDSSAGLVIRAPIGEVLHEALQLVQTQKG